MTTREIIDMLQGKTLSVGECEDLWAIILGQECVIGSKIWVDDDILETCECMEENGRGVNIPEDTKKFIEDVKKELYTDVFNDCVDEEWWEIERAIRKVLKED